MHAQRKLPLDRRGGLNRLAMTLNPVKRKML